MTPGHVEAIKTHAAAFSDAPIGWPNEDFPDPVSPGGHPVDANGNPRPFIWGEIRSLRADRLSGDGRTKSLIQDEGFVRFHVMVPRGTGTDAAYALAEGLAAIFRVKSFGGVQTLAPTPAEGGAETEDGNFFGVSFSVPFWIIYETE